MSDLLLYLVKANVSLILFYLGYRLWLKKLTFFNINRLYLLFSLIFSSFYPLVDLSNLWSKAPEIQQGIITAIPDWQHIQFSVQTIEGNEYIGEFFWICFGLLFIRLLVKLFGIFSIHQRSTSAQWSEFRYRATSAITSPFSFWRNIYINPLNHKEGEFEKILKHESVHVKQLHSLDIMLSEITVLLFWYNPICWMIKKAMVENIEFLTDKKVLASGFEKQSYQYSLLNICTLTRKQSVLGNHFNLKNLKKRIMMMNKKETSRKHLGKYVFIVPAIVLGLFIFSVSRAYVYPVNTAINNNIIAEIFEEKLPNTPYDSLKSQLMNSEDKSSLQADDDITILVDGKKINNPVYIIDGKEVAKQEFEALKSEKVREIQVVKGDPTQVLISTKESAKSTGDNKAGIKFKIRSDDASVDNPIYILNGKEITKQDAEALEPETIKEIEVIKGDHIKKLYGEKGKDGVINITTKD